jgi:hypothetical protein
VLQTVYGTGLKVHQTSPIRTLQSRKLYFIIYWTVYNIGPVVHQTASNGKFEARWLTQRIADVDLGPGVHQIGPVIARRRSLQLGSLI